MTLKGTTTRLLARVLLAGPWRRQAERATVALGHSFPTNRLMAAFARHFGAQLISHEGPRFERHITLMTGGRMCSSGQDELCELSVMYYLQGALTELSPYDRPISALLHRAVRTGDIVFDVGANFGFYTFFVAPLCGTSGAVHAFEANPILAPHLLRSAALNQSHSRIVMNTLAVGKEADSTATLYGSGQIGVSSLYHHSWLDERDSVSVKVTTIDSYRQRNGDCCVDVMKIDIEGAERDAFLGMEETLTSCPPRLIICELMPMLNTYGSRPQSHLRRASDTASPVEIVDLLGLKGYKPRRIRTDGLIGALIDREELEHMSDGVINVAFVHDRLQTLQGDLFASE